MNKILLMLLSVGLMHYAWAEALPQQGFAKRIDFNVSAAGSSVLTDFPVLVRLSESAISGFKYTDCAADGSDLRFVDGNNTILPFEIDTWDTEGTSLVWVKLPTLMQGVKIVALYGNANPWPAPLSTAVWSDYVGVYHYTETATGEAVTVKDASGTQDGTADYRSLVLAGPIGNARGRTDSSAKGGGATMTVPETDALNTLVPTFTMSTWVRFPTTDMNWSYLFGRKNTDTTSAWGCQIGIASGLSPLRLWTNGTQGQPGNYPEFNVSAAVMTDQWIKLDAVYDNEKVRLYLDGKLIAEKTAVPGVAVNGTYPFAIGGPAGTGSMTSKAYFDETRLSVGAKSAEWVAMAYTNEVGAGLLTNKGAEDVDTDAVRFENPPVFEVTDAGYRVSVKLTSDSHGGAIYAVCGPEKPYAYATLMTANGVAGETYSAILTNFPVNAMCGIGVKGVSSATGSKVTMAYGEGDFLSGAVTVMKTSDASEENLTTPGVFTVSRPDTPDAKRGDLQVNYSVGGTAVAGTHYVPLSGTVTIPDGSASVTVAVTPLCTWIGTTLELSLSGGRYELGDPSSASMKLYPRRRVFGFAKQVFFEVTDAAGDDGLENFPLLVRLSEASVSGFSYADCAADGSDLRFVDDHANPLPFEIDTWDPSGTSLVWVKIPRLTPGVKIIALYGNDGELWPAPSVVEVWGDYVGVYHYRETTAGAVTVTDSSGTQDGTSDSRSILTAGPIGNARGRTDGSGTKGAMMSVSKTDKLDTLAPTFTFSTWLCPMTNEMNWAYLFGRKLTDNNPAWGCQIGASSGFEKLRLWTNGNSGFDGNYPLFDPRPEMAAEQWVKVDAVYDNEKVLLYLNGVLKAEKAAIPGVATNGTASFVVGGPAGGYHGTAIAFFDETRLSVGAKSAAWVAMEYKNETETSLLSNSGAADVNTEEVQFLGAPTFSWSAEEGYQVSVTMSPFSAMAALTAFCGTEKPYEYATEMVADAEAGRTYTVALTSLPENAMCGFSVRAVKVGDPTLVVTADGDGVFMSAAVNIAKLADIRAEAGGTEGVFTVSRPNLPGTTSSDLVVNYLIGGTAVPGVNYEPLSGTVTIPSGSASAAITVTPKTAWTTTELTLTLTDGRYGIGSQGFATMTILAGRKNAGFAKSVDCTVSDLADGVVLTNFPVLVRLSESAVSGFSYVECAEDGSDLRFVDTNENPLPFEIDTWNTEGASLVWVKLPILKKGMKVTALYGNDEPWPTLDTKSVWSDYAGVYHFSEGTDGAVTITNSVGSGLNNGTAHENSLVTAGPLGNARGRTGAYGYSGTTMTVVQNEALDGLVPTFTVSMWVQPTTDAQRWGAFFSRKQADGTPSWGMQCRGTDNGNLGRYAIYTSGNADKDDQRAIFTTDKLAPNVWTKVDVVYDEMKVRMFLDGELLAEEDAKPDVAKNSTLDFAVGGNANGGFGTAQAYFDETRLSVGAKSAEWIAMAYTNEVGSGLLTNTGAAVPDVDRVRFDGNPIVTQNRGVVTLSGRLSDASGTGVLTVHYGIGRVYDHVKTISTQALPGSAYEVQLDGISYGETYRAFVRGESAAHTVSDIEVEDAFVPIAPPGTVVIYF